MVITMCEDDSIVSLAEYLLKKLEKFSLKNKQIKKLVCRRILKNIPVSSKMYHYVKCRPRTRSNNDSIKFVQKMRKKKFVQKMRKKKFVQKMRKKKAF